MDKRESKFKKKKSAKTPSQRSSGPQPNQLEKQFRSVCSRVNSLSRAAVRVCASQAHIVSSLLHRSAAEDLQKLDETFESRLKGLKQQAAQRDLVS